ncbi:hypothetical protein D3C81_1910120 [compost metagenome]
MLVLVLVLVLILVLILVSLVSAPAEAVLVPAVAFSAPRLFVAPRTFASRHPKVVASTFPPLVYVLLLVSSYSPALAALFQL